MEINKDVFQAIVLMDTFNSNFTPVSKSKSMAFLQVAGVPLLEYTLQSLAVGGITETILFCCQDSPKIRDYVNESTGLWKYTMDVQVKSSDTCQSIGDVMREVDAAALVKGDFILLGINTITNIDFATLLEQHKQIVKKDKGAAMTLVYREASQEHALIKSDKSVFLAADSKTRKVLFHQKFTPKSTENTVALPTKHILSHSEVKLHHNLVDPNIAVCSPSVPALFSDNFDFQTRDDFVHGLLIQEDILTDSLYYTFVASNKYAAAVSNWKTYRTVSHDILHNWAYPLSIESGINKEFVYLGKYIYRNKTATLNRSCTLNEDVLIGGDSHLGDNTSVSKSFIGNNVTIGKNVTIENSYIMDKAVIKDNVKIVNSFIDEECSIGEDCCIEGGTIITQKLTVLPNTKHYGAILEKTESKNEKQIQQSQSEFGTEWENESTGSGEGEWIGLEAAWSKASSCYSSRSELTEGSDEPALDDASMFLNEVIDSLARGLEDRLKCDYLILEINSSRYAYNISLDDVNALVVRAALSVPPVVAAGNCLAPTLVSALAYFRPILRNYIKTKTSIGDCLRAVEESCCECEWLQGAGGHVFHAFYDIELVDEDSLLIFHRDLKARGSDLLHDHSFNKFYEWLQEADEETDDDDDDDD